MSNQELLYLICLERVNEGGGSKYYSYYILTPLLLHQPKVLFIKGIEIELYDDRYE